MFHSFYKSRHWALWAYGGGFLLILVLWLQVQLSVAINTWYGDFYNLLQTATDYEDNPSEGIALFFSKLVGMDYLIKDDFEGTYSATTPIRYERFSPTSLPRPGGRFARSKPPSSSAMRSKSGPWATS